MYFLASFESLNATVEKYIFYFEKIIGDLIQLMSNREKSYFQHTEYKKLPKVLVTIKLIRSNVDKVQF